MFELMDKKIIAILHKLILPNWPYASSADVYYLKYDLRLGPGFYTKLNVWGSLGLNFEYDGGPIIEIGGPIFLYKLQIFGR